MQWGTPTEWTETQGLRRRGGWAHGAAHGQLVREGVGYWGDMVVELKNGDKVEMRALPKFRELQAYILERRDALKSAGSKGSGKVRSPGGGGF